MKIEIEREGTWMIRIDVVTFFVGWCNRLHASLYGSLLLLSHNAMCALLCTSKTNQCCSAVYI